MTQPIKSRQERNTSPDWADAVRPDDDVMALLYAPTGQPKTGPLLNFPAVKPVHETIDKTPDTAIDPTHITTGIATHITTDSLTNIATEIKTSIAMPIETSKSIPVVID